MSTSANMTDQYSRNYWYVHVKEAECRDLVVIPVYGNSYERPWHEIIKVWTCTFIWLAMQVNVLCQWIQSVCSYCHCSNIALTIESLDRYRWEDKMTDRQTDRPTDRQIRDQKAITDQTAEIFSSGLYVPQWEKVMSWYHQSWNKWASLH